MATHSRKVRQFALIRCYGLMHLDKDAMPNVEKDVSSILARQNNEMHKSKTDMRSDAEN